MDWFLKVAHHSIVVVAFELLEESADVSSTSGGNVGFILFAREIPAKGKLTVLGKHFVLTFVIAFLWSFCFPVLYPESRDYRLEIYYFLLSGYCSLFLFNI